MERRLFLHRMAHGLVASGVIGRPAPGLAEAPGMTQRKPPNILFLFTDDQRFNTIHALNCPQIRTPNLDRLAARGVAFNCCYILGSHHGAVCMPSRAMLMTGRHYFNLPSSVTETWAVPEEERGRCEHVTFPELLRRNGYATWAVGKQHNGRRWIEDGFDAGRALFMAGMGPHFNTRVRDYDAESGWGEEWGDPDRYSNTVFADAAAELLARREEEKPFLLWVSFTAPHDPRTAPREYHDLYPADDPELPPNVLPGHPFPIADMRIRDEQLAAFPRTGAEVRRHIADYYAMITATDAEIGRILDALAACGEADNTVVVFSGDNGLALGQHGLMGKQSVYEHSVRVPLIFAGPDLPRNRRSDALVHLHDVFPTLCDLLGLDAPASVETRSLLPAIRDPERSVRDAILCAYSSRRHRLEKGEPDPRGQHRSVRRGDWKLIASHLEGITTLQLFNLRDDPWEMRNRAGEAGQAERLEAMQALLGETQAACGDPAGWGAGGITASHGPRA